MTRARQKATNEASPQRWPRLAVDDNLGATIDPSLPHYDFAKKNPDLRERIEPSLLSLLAGFPVRGEVQAG